MQILKAGEYVGDLLNEVHHGGVFASVSAYNKNGFNDSWHCHENAHISFVLKGGCLEKKKDRYDRLPGEATFYLSGEPHKIIDMHNSIHVNLEMEDSFFDQFGFTQSAFGKTAHKTPDAKFLMLKVFRELTANDNFTITSVNMLLLEFLAQAEKWRSEEKIPSWMKCVHDLMNDRWSETIHLADLSEATGVHPVTISSYFPQYFSCTLGTYMRKLKVEKALFLLKSSEASLTDIAYECGFFDQSHFIRTFKQMTGFLPTRYKKI